MIAVFGAGGGVGSAVVGHLHSHTLGPVVPLTRKDCELTSPDEVEGCFHRLHGRYPPSEPWHIINAAGSCNNGKVAGGDLSGFHADYMCNVFAPSLILKYVFPYFVDRPNSSVTLMSSVVAPIGVVGAASYGTSKAALTGLCRSAAKEFARFRARVNVLELGYFDMGMIDKVPMQMQAKLIDEIPLHRFGNAYDIGVACQFAIDCHYLTGAVVPVNGGLL